MVTPGAVIVAAIHLISRLRELGSVLNSEDFCTRERPKREDLDPTILLWASSAFRGRSSDLVAVWLCCGSTRSAKRDLPSPALHVEHVQLRTSPANTA
jgi:hypothetical protein